MEKSSWRTELAAGLTTFFTMAYIIVVNPSILSTPGTGMPFSGVLTATVILSFLMTLFMGLYAKLPFAVAPGMGVNAFFTFSLILGQKIPWPVALGMIFWSGLFFVVISVTPLRVEIAKAIPKNLRVAAAAGIGVFLTFIGLKNCGFIVSDPVTFVRPGVVDEKILLSLIGLVFILILLKRKSPFAFLGGIALVTLLALLRGHVSRPTQWVALPDFQSVMFKLDVLGALKLSFLAPIISILFTDFFDSLSTFIGVAQAGKFLEKDGNPKNLKQGLVVDAFATLFAGIFGTSSGTAFIESAAGIEMGGRTGLTAIFTSLCFLPCLFIAPLVAMVPSFATAPVLIVIGVLMFRSISELRFDRLEEALPAFLTLILIPLTFSITQGILWGFISHVVCFFIFGRRKEVPPMMYGLALLSVGLLYLGR